MNYILYRASIVWPYLVDSRLAYRKRRCVASWYSRHGWSYVLLLLVYSNGLLMKADGVLTVSADVANSGRTNANVSAVAAAAAATAVVSTAKDGNSNGAAAVTSLSLTVSAVSPILPKTDAMIKMPTIATNAVDDESYDDDSDEDEPLVVGVPGRPC